MVRQTTILDTIHVIERETVWMPPDSVGRQYPRKTVQRESGNNRITERRTVVQTRDTIYVATDDKRASRTETDLRPPTREWLPWVIIAVMVVVAIAILAIRITKRVIAILFPMVLAMGVSAYQPIKFATAPQGRYRVVRIYDGDTFTILVPPDNTYNIRIQGIDAPERRQEFGMYARLYLERLIDGKEVMVYPVEVDKWGRTAAQCFNHEGKDIGLEMIKAGMAWQYAPYNNNEKYVRAEQMARMTGMGLWCRPKPMNPQEYRQAPREIKGKYQ